MTLAKVRREIRWLICCSTCYLNLRWKGACCNQRQTCETSSSQQFVSMGFVLMIARIVRTSPHSGVQVRSPISLLLQTLRTDDRENYSWLDRCRDVCRSSCITTQGRTEKLLQVIAKTFSPDAMVRCAFFIGQFG